MSISAKLFVDDQEYNILEYDLQFSQDTDVVGKPVRGFKGGNFSLKVETIKSSLLLQWMLNGDAMKKVKIVFPSRTGRSQSRTIELLDTHCIENKKSFNASSAEPLFTSIVLSPATMIENGEIMFSKSWRVTDPTPRERKPAEDKDDEKKLILSFTAKKDDITDGKFGFDKFDEDFKQIYKGTNFTTFENEYNPIQVYGEKYFPVWVSMRSGQTITLKVEQIKLGKVKTKNYDLYEEIKFEDHPDFTFAPANLKDAKEVRITCNNNNAATAQIKLEADDETVGAINFFYPAPKTVGLNWRFIEITGNNQDGIALLNKINVVRLTGLLTKAFNPMLIDFTIENEKPIFVDLSRENLIGVLDKEGETQYIVRGRKESFVAFAEKASPPSGTSVTLYLAYRACMDKENAIKEEGYSVVAGFSGINSGIAYGILADKVGKMLPEAIAHEIMHALGLAHTFKVQKGHKFEDKSTQNYMDYATSKIYTWKWQWEIARNNNLLR